MPWPSQRHSVLKPAQCELIRQFCHICSPAPMVRPGWNVDLPKPRRSGAISRRPSRVRRQAAPQAANPDKRPGCPWGCPVPSRPGAPIGEPDVVRRLVCRRAMTQGVTGPVIGRAGMLIEQTPAATIESARSHCARYFGTACQNRCRLAEPRLAIMGALGGAFLAAAVSRFRAMLARQT